MLKKFVRSPLLSLLAVALFSLSTFAQDGGLWTEVNESALMYRPANRTEAPAQRKTFRLNRNLLASKLSVAPDERLRSPQLPVIEIPMPDGSLQKFRFERSLVVEPGLLEKYPELGETFRGVGVDDPTAYVRFDFLPTGFHAMVMTENGTIMVDPYAKGDVENYVTFNKGDLKKPDFKCEVDGDDNAFDSLTNPEFIRDNTLGRAEAAQSTTSGTTLRTYRLALAATFEYSAAIGGGTIAGTLAAQVAAMNRVNSVYERDLSIRMVIVANNDKVIYAADQQCGASLLPCTAALDPFSNNSGSTMLGQNINNMALVIGNDNFDIGHVFSTGGGGVAGLGVPCGASKARGVTGLGSAVLLGTDAFYIDYVAHEMGHQWGANHSYNGSGGGCNTRRADAAFEPGSGVTIMGYAGLCDAQDLALNSIDTFHVKSLEEIVNYSQNGNGSTCGVQTPTGNTPPTVSIAGGIIFDVPKQTPFTLTANATDADGDTLTYDWQEYDLGPASSDVPNTDANGAIPIFRSYLPTTSPSRTFPRMQFILANASIPPGAFSCSGFQCLTGELMPQIGRAMQFQVIVRDNRPGGGGFTTATANVAVDSNSGPFEVTSQGSAASYAGGSTQAVTWNVNNTTASPVGAANVRILFSADGGTTFPIVLADSTPNDGSADVVMPQIATTRARIKVEPVGKIFFDVNNADFTVTVSAQVTVTGKVTTPAGNALRDIKVSMIDGAGVRRTATTSSFGEYSFANVPGGVTYTLTAGNKRYRFSPRIIPIGTANVGNVDFVGQQ